MSKRILTLFLLLSILTIQDSSAQLFKRKKARRRQKAPKALLVELHTYNRTANFFREKGNNAKLKSLAIARDSVNDRLIMDFTDNFSYCPVYFFIDTNMQRVLSKKFDGVLLDAALNPVEKAVINAKDSNYHIVYFGQPPAGFPEVASRDEKNDPYDAGYSTQLRARKRLVALNHKGQPIKKPMPAESNSTLVWGKLKKGRYYFYRSKEHDIYYVPYAKNFSATLHRYYGPYPYTNQ